jgi:hypothetical protein
MPDLEYLAEAVLTCSRKFTAPTHQQAKESTACEPLTALRNALR